MKIGCALSTINIVEIYKFAIENTPSHFLGFKQFLKEYDLSRAFVLVEDLDLQQLNSFCFHSWLNCRLAVNSRLIQHESLSEDVSSTCPAVQAHFDGVASCHIFVESNGPGLVAVEGHVR